MENLRSQKKQKTAFLWVNGEEVIIIKRSYSANNGACIHYLNSDGKEGYTYHFHKSREAFLRHKIGCLENEFDRWIYRISSEEEYISKKKELLETYRELFKLI